MDFLTFKFSSVAHDQQRTNHQEEEEEVEGITRKREMPMTTQNQNLPSNSRTVSK